MMSFILKACAFKAMVTRELEQIYKTRVKEIHGILNLNVFLSCCIEITQAYMRCILWQLKLQMQM